MVGQAEEEAGVQPANNDLNMYSVKCINKVAGVIIIRSLWMRVGMCVLLLSVMLVLAASQTNPCAATFGAFCLQCSNITGQCT